MKQESISVIIVTYNNAHQVRTCLSSLRFKPQPQEIILIDNNSRDQIRREIQLFLKENPAFPLECTWNQNNRGFAHAVNQGLQKAKGEFILLLTPDAVLLPGSLKILLDFMLKNPQAAMTAPQLITPQNKIQPSCRRFPTYRDLILELTGLPRLTAGNIHSRWKMDDFDHQSVKEVHQAEATCMLVRAAFVQKVGIMDERFPIFFNDVDWCKRFQLSGLKIYFLPHAQAIHHRGTSVSIDRAAMIWKSHQGFFRYFQKYYNTSQALKILNFYIGFLLIITALLRSIPFIMSTKNRGSSG